MIPRSQRRSLSADRNTYTFSALPSLHLSFTVLSPFLSLLASFFPEAKRDPRDSRPFATIVFITGGHLQRVLHPRKVAGVVVSFCVPRSSAERKVNPRPLPRLNRHESSFRLFSLRFRGAPFRLSYYSGNDLSS